jgi:hypothetical protein
MGTLHDISAPPPALSVTGDRAPVANAYFAVTIDAAVDLSVQREYQNLTRAERISRARAEQQDFLSGFLDPELGAALDLRVAVDPAAANPLSVALLGRTWGGSADAAAKRAEELRDRVQAALPRHVTGSAVQDPDVITRLLRPFPGAAVDSAVITRHELISAPARPDAGVSYYYSALPLRWSDDDWSGGYAALAASPVPLVLSVAVLPMPVPAPFAQMVGTLASFYGRLATEGEAPGGFPHGRHRLPPDAFAVHAEQAFRHYSRHLARQAFALRIQISAARRLPPGVTEAIAEAIAPAAPGALAAGAPGYPRRAGGFPAPGCDIRRPASAAERRLAEYNLNFINFGMLTGRQEIWGRHDPPDPQLAMLPMLGDARDGASVFRFPIAADGSVPGFPVNRGQPGAYQPDGPAIRIGTAQGTGTPVALPLRSLAGHTVIAGSAGSGAAGTAAGLLRQLWAEHGVPFLVIAPARADAEHYRELAAEPSFESLEVIRAGDEDASPLRFNPFEVPTGTVVGQHAASLLVCFTAAFGLTGPLLPVYQDALSLTYLRAGLLPAERPGAQRRSWPTVADFRAAMQEVTAGLGYPGEVMAEIEAGSVHRVGQLVNGVTGSALLSTRPGGIKRLLGHPVVIELDALGPGDEQALMMALLLSASCEQHQAGDDEPGNSERERSYAPGPTHVTVLERAHRLLARATAGPAGPAAQARERAAAALAEVVLTRREHSEAVIIATPFPAALVSEAVRGASVKIMHRLSAEDDRRCLTGAMPLRPAHRALAAQLPAGEAVLASDEIGESEHVAVTPPRDPGQTGPGRRADWPAAPDSPPALPPFTACDCCRAQCAYRGAALALLNDPRTVAGITAAARPEGSPDATPPEDPARLAGLRGALFDAVAGFAALPTADPGRSDAAFCLFLHVHASGPLRLRPQWPAVAAQLLGITAATGETGAGPGG